MCHRPAALIRRFDYFIIWHPAISFELLLFCSLVISVGCVRHSIICWITSTYLDVTSFGLSMSLCLLLFLCRPLAIHLAHRRKYGGTTARIPCHEQDLVRAGGISCSRRFAFSHRLPEDDSSSGSGHRPTWQVRRSQTLTHRPVNCISDTTVNGWDIAGTILQNDRSCNILPVQFIMEEVRFQALLSLVSISF